MKKLVQTGEDNEGVFNVMDGLSFARAINDNATALGTETKLDLEIYNTPEAIAKALKEQAGKIGFHTPGGPDDLPTFEEKGAPVNSPSKQEGGIAQIYNEALGDTTKSIAITTPPTKVEYTEGETFDPTGLVVKAVHDSGSSVVIDNEDLTFSPTIDTPLTTSDTLVTISYNELNCTQSITVNES